MAWRCLMFDVYGVFKPQIYLLRKFAAAKIDIQVVAKAVLKADVNITRIIKPEERFTPAFRTANIAEAVDHQKVEVILFHGFGSGTKDKPG
jgi:hypothetical protein